VTAPATPDALRAELVDLSHELGRPDRDWTILAEGNSSLRSGPDSFLVKASGAWMSRVVADDFVEVSLPTMLELIDSPTAGDAEVSSYFSSVAETAPGGRRPSVESLLHAVCLDLPGVTAVGHTHPTAVNSLLCSPHAASLVDGSLFPDQIVVLGTAPLLIPYVDPGLKLAQVARQLLAERSVPRAIYLQNHGMFALGSSAAEVVQITQMAVKVAKVILGSLPASGPTYMDPVEVARIDTRPDELLRRQALAES
tara:strand:+ start:11675 stop:12436 length:762 start_codon:yes stop_codon:yes gene_type:complete